MYSYGSPHMAAQKQDDQHEHTFSSYVRIQDVVLKTYLGRWTIGRSGERGSGISVLPARYDDDDDESILSFVEIFSSLKGWLYGKSFQSSKFWYLKNKVLYEIFWVNGTGVWIDVIKKIESSWKKDDLTKFNISSSRLCITRCLI